MPPDSILSYATFALAGLAALVAIACLVILLVRRGDAGSLSAIQARLSALDDGAGRTDRTIRDETARMRNEAEERGKTLRGEIRDHFTGLGKALNETLESTRSGLRESLEGTRSGIEGRMDAFAKLQLESSDALRFVVGQSVTGFGETLKADIAALSDRLSKAQSEFQGTTRTALADVEKRVAALTEANEARQAALRQTLEERLDLLRAGNDAKLEQMRATVDEKLQGTLEKRLGESFKLVSERLENVQRGLGEMQSLATGVGDLKRVLTNVKTRGGWAEVQLGALLDNMLAPHQYAANVACRVGSDERVEFVVKLPGNDEAGEVLLPIDAKFPIEDYERLMEAQTRGDIPAIEAATKGVEVRIRLEARKIRDKYINPPKTCDFALLYLPTEGLYAEVLRRGSLAADIQRDHRVTVVGPTTLSAVLNSLQMGFKTLAIQKRSSEVWTVLGEAKSEFEKYGAVWDKLTKQLETAQKTVQDAGQRTRVITRKLKSVESAEIGPVAPTLTLVGSDGADEE